jgi:hypothetical protein
MARTKIPTALAMRELKYGDHSEAERDAIMAQLLAEDRRAEAILFFEGRPEHPGLRQEVQWAVQEGNAFHLLSVQRIGREVTPGEFEDCARAATERGRWMDARLCYLALGDEDALGAIAEHLPPALRPEALATNPGDAD